MRHFTPDHESSILQSPGAAISDRLILAHDEMRSASSDLPPLDVLHAARSVGWRAFGVGEIALSLTEAQRNLGHRVVNWSTDTPAELNEVSATGMASDHIRGFRRIGSERWGLSPQMLIAATQAEAARFSLLHQHGLWSACSLAVRRWQQVHRRPTVVAPHGTLDAWALRKSWLKKWFALRLFQWASLQHATCLHATSENEVAAFRQFGLTNPIAVIPNGVSEAWLQSRGDEGRFRQQFAIPADKRIALFLSRVTPKKGLPNLFSAIAEIGSRFNDWLLVVAGPDEFGHSRQLQKLAAELRILHFVRLIGPVYGRSRRDAFEAAELFVLPTRSEGHPMAILEALGARVPVLTTTGAPCEYLLRSRSGWQADINVLSLAAAMRDAVACSHAELADMGDRGRAFVQGQLTWELAARKSIALYRWLCGDAPRPDFVIMH